MNYEDWVEFVRLADDKGRVAELLAAGNPLGELAVLQRLMWALDIRQSSLPQDPSDARRQLLGEIADQERSVRRAEGNPDDWHENRARHARWRLEKLEEEIRFFQLPFEITKQRRPRGDSSVYQTSGGKYWVAMLSLGSKNGKRVRKAFYGKTPEEAMSKLRAHEERPLGPAEFRKCSMCGELKAVTEFSKSNPSRCLLCHRAYMRPIWRAWYRKNLSPTVRRRTAAR